jgi:hypothetical protein
MNARRFVLLEGNYLLKIHCGTCHKVEVIKQHVFTAGERKHHPWVLGENQDGPHWCSHKCFTRRHEVKLLRDPLPIPTPLTGSYEFKLGFWAAVKGYGASSKDEDYQRGHREAMELRKRYYTRRKP